MFLYRIRDRISGTALSHLNYFETPYPYHCVNYL